MFSCDIFSPVGSKMRILSLDSSTPQSASVALLEDQNILSQISSRDNQPYSNQILSMVDRALSGAHTELDAVDGFAVTAGPGSFTGLRVGISLLKGFALATGKPFVEVDTLAAVAALMEPADYPICAILDAKKKEVYAAFFRYRDGRLERLSQDCATPPETLRDLVSEPTAFIGSGLRTYGEFLSKNLGALYIPNPKTKDHSTAASAALLARPQFDAGKSFDLNSLKINYVRKSEAEINLGKTNVRKHQERKGD